MPCALRTRPTIVRSGAVTSLARAARGGVRGRLTHRNGGRVQLARQPRLMARLEHPRLSQQGPDRVGRQGADVEPVVRSLRIELHGLVALARIVLANDLDEAAIARARRLSDHDAERRSVLAAA